MYVIRTCVRNSALYVYRYVKQFLCLSVAATSPPSPESNAIGDVDVADATREAMFAYLSLRIHAQKKPKPLKHMR